MKELQELNKEYFNELTIRLKKENLHKYDYDYCTLEYKRINALSVNLPDKVKELWTSQDFDHLIYRLQGSRPDLVDEGEEVPVYTNFLWITPFAKNYFPYFLTKENNEMIGGQVFDSIDSIIQYIKDSNK